MPGTICSVAICKNSFYKQKEGEEKLMFFSFPKDDSLRKEWIRRCFRKDSVNPKTGRICNVQNLIFKKTCERKL